MLAVLGLIFLATVLYCSTALLLGLNASTFTHKSTNSLLTAILLWLVFIFVAPRIGMLSAEKLAPLDSPETLSLQEELLRKDIRDRKNAELGRIFSSENYDDERKPIVDRYQAELASTLGQIRGSYLRARARQERLAILLGALSPVTHLTTVATELTQTGFGTVRRLLRDVHLYEATVYETVYSLGYQDQIPNAGVRMVYETVDLEQLPRFTQTIASLGDRLEKCFLPIVFLILFNALLFIIAYVKGIRYDPR